MAKSLRERIREAEVMTRPSVLRRGTFHYCLYIEGETNHWSKLSYKEEHQAIAAGEKQREYLLGVEDQREADELAKRVAC